MSKPDQNKIEFHAVVVTDKEAIKQSKMNILQYRQDSQARDLGLLIAQTKGWKTQPTGDTHTSHLDLYVFTRNELQDYMDAVFKDRLRTIALRSSHLSEDEKQVLLDASERF